MVKCRESKSELQTEANLGVMKNQVQFYQVDNLGVLEMETLMIVLKSLRNQNL